MKILVTAGPTREFMDPVRFLTNRSSGKMGYALAAAAVDRDHDVRLISGPVAIEVPACVAHIPVESTAEMLAAVRAHASWCDVLIMAAAPADFRPVHRASQKLKKATMPPSLELEPTEDILCQVAGQKRNGQFFVGFAAETQSVMDEARRKLEAKSLDMIVANNVTDAGAGFEVDTNRVTVMMPGREPDPWPLMAKRRLADLLIQRIEEAI